MLSAGIVILRATVALMAIESLIAAALEITRLWIRKKWVSRTANIFGVM